MDVEVALAIAEAKLGVIPKEAATEIATKAKVKFLNIESIRNGIEKTRHPLMPIIYELQRTEIGEVEEPFIRGEIGSSTMPHKLNPWISELVVRLSKVISGNVLTMLSSIIQEHERDAKAWHRMDRT